MTGELPKVDFARTFSVFSVTKLNQPFKRRIAGAYLVRGISKKTYCFC
jgi:hypothetical protein